MYQQYNEEDDYDITEDGYYCFEKALFNYLEQAFTDTTDGGLCLYTDYYTRLTLVDVNVNISGFQRKDNLVNKVFKTLYKHRSPQLKPEGFNFKNEQDLTRLARLLNIEIVIFYNVKRVPEIWFSSCKIPLYECKKQIFYFITDHEASSLKTTNYISLQKPFFSSNQYIDLSTCGFTQGFELLMNFKTSGLKTTSDFISHQEQITQDNRINDCITVFSYVGNDVLKIPHRHLKQRTKPQKCHFSQTIYTVGKCPQTLDDIHSLTPLILYGNILCIPTPEFIKRIREQVANIYSTVSRDDANINVLQENIQKLSKEKRDAAYETCLQRKARAKEKRQKKWKEKDKKEKEMVYKLLNITPDHTDTEEQPTRPVIEKLCKCYICTVEAKNYSENMSLDGQEKLCTIKPSCYELLKMLGIDTLSNRQIIDSLCELSMASFDIEAMTLKTAQTLNLPAEPKYSELGGIPEHTVKVQKPIMLAHTDGLKDVKVYRLSDYTDTYSESSIFEMMEAYWNDVVLRHSQIKEIKKTIAEPLLNYLEDYRKAHMEFVREYDVGDNEAIRVDMGKNYFNTLPGLLEHRISELIQEYIIFSFYGSGYDMVMIEEYLLPYMFETKQRPKLDKKGDKVLLISTANGIKFRDITKLLAPSTNLRSFGKLFSLNVEKGHFPFKILQSLNSLLEPELPTSQYMWKSELTGAPTPSKKEIAEAIAIFKEKGFKNVGEYLEHYLILDVDILHKASNLWRKRLFNIIGLDFIDIKKFTISSFSYYANANTSAKLLRPGWFFPNNCQHYALLKRGMRG